MDSPPTPADEFINLMTRLRRLRAASSLPPGVQVSPALMPIINYLAQNPQSSVKEVAGHLGLATPTVSISLRRLERMGLTSRQPHPQDQRMVLVSLTPQGEELHQQVRQFRRQLAADMLSGLEAEERNELLRLLNKALDAAENGESRQEPPSQKRRIV